MKEIKVNLGRKLSVENSRMLGHGYYSQVYQVDPETVVKVLKNGTVEDAEREIKLSKWAFSNGISTAISYDVVDIDGHPGLVYELLGKGSLRDRLLNYPDEFDRRLRQYADLMHTIHNVVDTEAHLPKALDFYTEKLDDTSLITEDERQRMRMLLDTIPDTSHIVHRDCHIKNIKVVNDDLMLIDLDTLSRGDPIFDFMSVFCAYKTYSEGHGYTETDTFFDMPIAFEKRILGTLFLMYFSDLEEDDLQENINKVALLSYLHMLIFLDECDDEEKSTYDTDKMVGSFREYLYKSDDLRLKY